ncbi:hypothetical protein SAMN05444002_1242 [Vannielia litorea]|uniref:Uncharacterized protein n=2 Tax=Vannielia litorea TaxID=1217970 RepID=A0A1N6EZU4_9RHOB|nr:hypothetical protein SAMN05444002_1242 [Vannielia litorea]
MVDWVVTGNSNGMDRMLGYQRVLREMRQFVANNAAGTMTINIHRSPGNAPPTTSLTMSANNFTVTHINGHAINYNYGALLPFLASDLDAFPAGAVQVSLPVKAKLLYMLPEAARSVPIEEDFTRVIQAMGTAMVDLNRWFVPVHVYDKTCTAVGLDSASPARPLTAADYRQYANGLGNVKDKHDLLQMFPA